MGQKNLPSIVGELPFTARLSHCDEELVDCHRRIDRNLTPKVRIHLPRCEMVYTSRVDTCERTDVRSRGEREREGREGKTHENSVCRVWGKRMCFCQVWEGMLLIWSRE